MSEPEQLEAFAVDGYTVEKVVLRFSGSVTLDPHDPRHRRLIDAVRLGGRPMLLVRGSVTGRREDLDGATVNESPRYTISAALGPDDYSAFLTESVGDMWDSILAAGDAPTYADPNGEPADVPGPAPNPAPADGALVWTDDDIAADGKGGQYELAADPNMPANARWWASHRAAGDETPVELNEEGLSKVRAKAAAQTHHTTRMAPPADATGGDAPDDHPDAPAADPAATATEGAAPVNPPEWPAAPQPDTDEDGGLLDEPDTEDDGPADA